MKHIILTRGYAATVDDEDYERVNKYNWFTHIYRDREGNVRGTYATRRLKLKGKWTHQSMHRFVMNSPEGEIIDHKNHDGLDNQKHNLRACTLSGNIANSTIRYDNTSGYKGVSYYARSGKWRAAIGHGGGGRKKHLGYFATKEEAAEVYRSAALEVFGEFAFTG